MKKLTLLQRGFHLRNQNWNQLQKPSIFDVLESSAHRQKGMKCCLTGPLLVFHFQHATASLPKNIHKSITIPNLLSVSVGEDAYFSRHNSLGIADGVGGWVSVKGANPALYSRMLMHYAASEFETYDTPDFESDPLPIESTTICPKSVLRNSYGKVKTLETLENLVGSTTALIVQLKNDELSMANIGDCGIMVLRDYDIIFRSEEQQHSFNYPFQLGSKSRDSPEDCQSYTMKLHESDIIVMGSDGIWDNLFDEDVVDIVKGVVGNVILRKPNPSSIKCKEIADALLARSRMVATDRHAESPFQSRAIQEGIYYQGGKMDDMTCIVAVVKQTEDSPDRR